jgi:hypothetical protein
LFDDSADGNGADAAMETTMDTVDVIADCLPQISDEVLLVPDTDPTA